MRSRCLSLLLPLAAASSLAGCLADEVVVSTDGGAGKWPGSSDMAMPKYAVDFGAPSSTASCKRGLAYGQQSPADLKALSQGVNWWYNWSPAPDNALAPSYASLGVEFVPMVWGSQFTVAGIEADIPAGAKYLLAFNEPNFKTQANVSPQQAAALWPQIEKIAADKGLAIVSPALNYCGPAGSCWTTNPFDWLDAFFAACPDCKVDYVGAHWYACDKSALVGYLGQYRKYHRPVWLTEWSCLDGNNRSELAQEKYMNDALSVLENDPNVFRYSWFTGRFDQVPAVNLLAADGQLTPLGRIYVDYPRNCAP